MKVRYFHFLIIMGIYLRNTNTLFKNEPSSSSLIYRKMHRNPEAVQQVFENMCNCLCKILRCALKQEEAQVSFMLIEINKIKHTLRIIEYSFLLLLDKVSARENLLLFF